jgi:hypothetical protein
MRTARLTALALLLAAASPALAQTPAPAPPPLAARWVLLSASPTTTLYVDQASLKKAGPILNITSLMIASQPITVGDKSADAVWSNIVIDCGARTAQVVKETDYNTVGSVVAERPGGPGLNPIGDGSLADALSLACDEELTGVTLTSIPAAYADSRSQMAQAKTAQSLPQGVLTLATATSNAALFVIQDLTKKSGDLADAWLFEVYDPANDVGGGKSVMGVSRQVMDCSKRAFVAQIWVAFDETGRVLGALPGEEPSEINPASPLSAVANVICGKTTPPATDKVVGYAAARELGKARIKALVTP